MGGVAIPHVSVDPVQPHHAHPAGQFAVPGDHHAALSGGDRFGRVKRVDPHGAEGPGSFPLPFSGETVGRILDHQSTVGSGDIQDLFHPAG